MPKLLLIGLGHAHLELLKTRFADRRRRSRWSVFCITPHPSEMIYTGMVTGILAGDYSPTQATLHPGALAAKWDAQLIEGQPIDIDSANRRVVLDDRRAIEFDYLSIAVGSTTHRLPCSETDVEAEQSPAIDQVPIRPIDSLVSRLESSLHARSKSRVVVVGGGWGAIETALCLAGPRCIFRDSIEPPIRLVAGDGSICRRRSVAGQIAAAGITVVHEHATQVDRRGLATNSGNQIVADTVLLAGGPAPIESPAFQRLPRTDEGFLRTNPNLSVAGERAIFALGDAAGPWYKKSGVNALRQGRLLWENLQRSEQGKTLRIAKRRIPTLQLINCGDSTALMHWGPILLRAGWAWTLKDAIDRRYLARMK